MHRHPCRQCRIRTSITVSAVIVAAKGVEMRDRFWLGFSVAFALVLGCAATLLFVPPSSAQQTAPGMTRWEYKCLAATGSPDRRAQATEALSNAMGRQAWEIAAIDAAMTCFKRPLR
jgi:hypothetical protein